MSAAGQCSAGGGGENREKCAPVKSPSLINDPPPKKTNYSFFKNRKSIMKTNSSSQLPFTDKINEAELQKPVFATVPKLIWFSVRDFLQERPGRVIISAFILLMVWGTHGNLELLTRIWPSYRGPGIDIGTRPQLIQGIPWDNELISFWVGCFLLVVVPILLIKFWYKKPLGDFGLGLPPKGRRMLALWSFLILTIPTLFFFWLGTFDHDMRVVYPLYKPFTNSGAFLLYELTYLPFFIAIEFIFRGYLLFGLADTSDISKNSGNVGMAQQFYIGRYALLIQMLSYTAWHLGKPIPELWATIIWGLAAGAAIYAIRSIWPIVGAHWLLNVFMDAIIAKPF
jgi:hypothetical protein